MNYTTDEARTKEVIVLEQSRGVYKKEYRDVTIRTTDGNILKGKVNIGLKARAYFFSIKLRKIKR